MDSLPPEMKLEIFQQLSIRDSIKCRQVCKDWLTIIDCLRYKSLNFQVSNCGWSKTNYEERDVDLWITIDDFVKFFRSVTMDSKFCNLKVMKGLGKVSEIENLDDFVNQFNKLEQLDLYSAPMHVRFVLKLKFLRKLNFHFPPNKTKLETPSLVHLMTRELSRIELCYPEQIKCLGTEVTFGVTDSLTKFKNLEILIVIESGFEHTVRHLSVYLLERSPQLKRVYVCRYIDCNSDEMVDRSIDKNSDLKVYYFGFKINSDIFGNFDWTDIQKSKKCKWLTRYVTRNWSTSIDENPFILQLDYSRLLDEFDQNIPSDFLKKISKLCSVTIDNLDDEMKILEFLDSTKPRCVSIENPTLTRSFLEQLSKFSFFNKLCIYIDEWPTFFNDFNFHFESDMNLLIVSRYSLKSLRPVFEFFERARSIRLYLVILIDEFSFVLDNTLSDSSNSFSIEYQLNEKRISTSCTLKSSDFEFYFYLDRQVPNIVEFKDKLELFSIVEEYNSKFWEEALNIAYHIMAEIVPHNRPIPVAF